LVDLLKQLTHCIERGKIDRNAPYPPDMKGSDGAVELTGRLLENKVPPEAILSRSLIPGMNAVGEKFEHGEAFIPELLISAKSMQAAMELLKPYFISGELKYKGTVVLGTVAGDLHDIGKNIVGMVLEGDGWKIVDLGVNVPDTEFLKALEGYPESIIGMSALLTTSLKSMETIAGRIRENFPNTDIYIGGAPVTQDYCDMIGTNGYFPEPHSFVKHLAILKDIR